MARSWSFTDYTDPGPEAGAYVDRVSELTGKSKSQIIAQSVILAKRSGLFEGVDPEGAEGADESDVDPPTDSDGEDSGGGVRAGDLAQMEGEEGEAGPDDPPQPEAQGSGNEQPPEPPAQPETEPDDPLKSMLDQW